MGRPSKPYAVLAQEKKSHRTKAEMDARKKGEAAFATGETLKEKPETRQNLTAHKEFLRLKKILMSINKWDAIYENVINRYCLLYAECFEFEGKREQFFRDLCSLDEEKEELIDSGMSVSTFYKLKNQMQKNIIDLDKQIQAKRKMLMDIEKENIMTIASALRNVPKKEETPTNPLLEVLKGG